MTGWKRCPSHKALRLLHVSPCASLAALCAIAALLSRSDSETWRRESLPAGEVQRYEAQYKFIQQICALYEEEPNDFGRLFTLIQEVRLTCFSHVVSEVWRTLIRLQGAHTLKQWSQYSHGSRSGKREH